MTLDVKTQKLTKELRESRDETKQVDSTFRSSSSTSISLSLLLFVLVIFLTVSVSIISLLLLLYGAGEDTQSYLADRRSQWDGKEEERRGTAAMNCVCYRQTPFKATVYLLSSSFPSLCDLLPARYVSVSSPAP